MMTEVVPDGYYELWTAFNQAYEALVRARENELRTIGLHSKVQAHVLFVLKAAGVPATPAEISRQLGREPHTVSGLLKRMEKQGLVEKARDPKRKNMRRVAITEIGEEAYQGAKELKNIRKILSHLSPGERSALIAYLHTVRDRALEEAHGERFS